jgi:hypothetical protein
VPLLHESTATIHRRATPLRTAAAPSTRARRTTSHHAHTHGHIGLNVFGERAA